MLRSSFISSVLKQFKSAYRIKLDLKRKNHIPNKHKKTCKHGYEAKCPFLTSDCLFDLVATQGVSLQKSDLELVQNPVGNNMPIVYCVVNSEDQSLMDILDIVEKLARELAFNLEVVKFSEALIHLNICANDVLHYYEILSFYFDRAFSLNLSSELIIRINGAHKFLSDFYSASSRNLLIDNCDVWLD